MGGFGNNMFAALSDPKKGSRKGPVKTKSKKKDSSGTGNKRRDSEATNTSDDGEVLAAPIDWTAATSQLGSMNWADMSEDDELDSLPALDILQQPSSKDDEDEDDDEEDDDDTEDPLAHVQDMIADDDDDADADAEETEGEDDGDGEGRNRSAEANAERGDEEGDEQPAHRATIRPLENLAAIEPERHLSKKELKRQELEELDSILAEFGIDATDRNENGADKNKEDEAARRKREKRKLKKAAGKLSATEADRPEETASKEVNGDANESKDEAQDEAEPKKNGPALDPTKLKALAAGKKKSKGSSVLNKVSAEAKARATKQAALKKKEMAKMNKKNNKHNQ